MMKSLLLSIYIFFCFSAIGQTDTIILEHSPSFTYKENYKDGYYILKKQNVTIQEFKIENGTLNGAVKEYYESGKLKLIANLKQIGFSYSYCGLYQEYYESGILKTQGNYQYKDSIDCLNCFDYFMNTKQDKAYREFVKTGIWLTFYENGCLESKGIYNGIHMIHHSSCDYPANKINPLGVFCAGGTFAQYIKAGEWEYFNTKENLIKREFYYNGFLAEMTTYLD